MLILFVRGDIEMKSSYITLTQHIEKADYLSFAAVILWESWLSIHTSRWLWLRKHRILTSLRTPTTPSQNIGGHTSEYFSTVSLLVKGWMIKRRVLCTSAGKYIKNFYNAMKIDIRIIGELIISESLEVKSSNNALLLIGIVKNCRCVAFILISYVDNLEALSKQFYSYRKMKDLKSNNHWTFNFLSVSLEKHVCFGSRLGDCSLLQAQQKSQYAMSYMKLSKGRLSKNQYN